MNIGDKFKVYQKPYTREDYEGRAIGKRRVVTDEALETFLREGGAA